MSEQQFINTSAYKFVSQTEEAIRELRPVLKEKAVSMGIKGTILLSTEGINLFLSAPQEALDAYKAFIETFPKFEGLPYKDSPSDFQPFSRMLVRLKKEIISMGHDEIKPHEKTATHLSPEQLKKWYEENHDMIILDTRNDYEVELGTFKDAIDFSIDSFRDFPDAIDLLPESAKEKPIVTFCTGGVRCEKAAQLMLNKGFKEVYQLDGGILNYFEQCGGDFYDGECFVFDKRVAVDATLQETETRQCYACRSPLMKDDQTEDGICPHCNQHRDGKRAPQSAHQ